MAGCSLLVGRVEIVGCLSVHVFIGVYFLVLCWEEWVGEYPWLVCRTELDGLR